jgi:hypothetical protein
MAGDSGRRHVATWVDRFDRLTEQLRAAVDVQVAAQLAEDDHMRAYSVLKDEIHDAEEAWDRASREREEADNDVQAILTEMQAIEVEATKAMELTVRPQDRDALEEEEADRLERDRLAGAARLALSPLELHAEMRKARLRAMTGVSA